MKVNQPTAGVCTVLQWDLFHTPVTNNLSQVYDGLRYRLSLEFPAGYPYQAPRVKFITTCFHPNVDDQGFICLDILKDKWSALYDVRSILLSIQSLLGGKTLPLYRYDFRSKSGALEMSLTEATCLRCQSSWVLQNLPQLVNTCSALNHFVMIFTQNRTMKVL